MSQSCLTYFCLKPNGVLCLAKPVGFIGYRAYLSRDDLASFSNMTASNAIRTLTQFCEEDILATDGRRLKIQNRAKLEHISEIG